MVYGCSSGCIGVLVNSCSIIIQINTTSVVAYIFEEIRGFSVQEELK